jgi:hypothetical protein
MDERKVFAKNLSSKKIMILLGANNSKSTSPINGELIVISNIRITTIVGSLQ